MNEITIMVLSLFLGLASGFIGGIATGGGLLAIPVLMFMGLPPSVAIATNNLASASSITSALRYHQSKLIGRNNFVPFLVATFFGGLVGSKLLLHIDPQLMQKFFGFVCLFLAFLLARNKIVIFKPKNKSMKLAGYFAVFLTDVFAGLFGTGGGFFMVYTLSYFFGMTLIQANANSKLISLGGALSIILVFLNAGVINFNAGIPLMIGSAIGGYIGSHTAIKKGDAKVKKIFLVIVVISGIKLILT